MNCTPTREHIAAMLDNARRRTLELTDVEDHDLVTQHSALMSPLVWDYAHIGNQEELWLVRDVGGREPIRADIDAYYDAFATPRRDRPALPLLNPNETTEYTATVRRQVLDVLDGCSLEGTRLLSDGFAFGMIAQHEQQHDETMLATHQLRDGPRVLDAPPPPSAARHPDGEVFIPGGPFTMGTTIEPWALDNERPAHTVDVPAFYIDAAPVTNARYAEFIADGGYDEPRWWTRKGWEVKTANSLCAPAHWQRENDQWWYTRFGSTTPVMPHEAVAHVCFHEARAFAAWAGKRLPSETEWEKAARFDPVSGRSRRFPWGDEDPGAQHANLGQTHLSPAEVGAYPAGASPLGVHQLIGDVWEWTNTCFAGYPGFEPFPYREYSQVFFGPDYRVLRGGSFATDSVACRGTFRNWDFPVRRQIFAGFRCARRPSAEEVL